MTSYRRFIPPTLPTADAARGLTCPRCQGDVLRVSRRRVDFLVSLFTPIRRFRCLSTECGWEGNLRIKRFSLLS